MPRKWKPQNPDNKSLDNALRNSKDKRKNKAQSRRENYFKHKNKTHKNVRKNNRMDEAKNNGNEVDNDDVIAQLRRQREKQQKQKELEETQNQQEEQSSLHINPLSLKSKRKTKTKTKTNAKPSSNLPKIIGGYKYDPKRKAYFPSHHVHSKCKQTKGKSNCERYTPPSIHIMRSFLSSYIRPSILLAHRTPRAENTNTHVSVLDLLQIHSLCTNTSKRNDLLLYTKEKIILTRSKFQPTTILCNVSLEKSKSIATKTNYYTKDKYNQRSKRMKIVNNRDERKHRILITDQDPISSQCDSDNSDVDKNNHSKLNTVSMNKSKLLQRNHWVSMLQPMAKPFVPNQERVSIPLDCKTKMDIHPTSRTFDVLSKHSFGFLPHIATIVSETIDTKLTDVFYRPAITSSPYLFDTSGESASCYSQRSQQNQWNDDGTNSIQSYSGFLSLPNRNTHQSYQSIRLARNHRDENSIYMGLLSYDSRSRLQTFLLSNLFSHGSLAQSSVGIQLTDKLNDFAFSTLYSSTQGIRKVAFAPIISSNPSQRTSPMVLDIPTVSIQSALGRHQEHTGRNLHPSFQSDVLCIEYYGYCIIYGQRNGCLTLLDERSGTVTHTLQSRFADFSDDNQLSSHRPVFGSVSSLKVLNANEKNANYPSSIVARGSFGSCHCFDLRRAGSSDAYKISQHDGSSSVSSTRPHSLLWQMRVPPHESINSFASTRCSGIAVSPGNFTCISPYISDENGGVQSSHLGMWSLVSGRYIGSVGLGTTQIGENLSPPYCELSHTVTEAWEIKQRYHRNKDKEKDTYISSIEQNQASWGLWLKSGNIGSNAGLGSFLITPPMEAGAVHHVTFPVS